VVGSGNFIEYQNLQEMAQSKGGNSMASPSTSLLSPGANPTKSLNVGLQM
jgi:hypothetical protein